MSFRLRPKFVTLSDLERRSGPYFALFHRIRHRKTIMTEAYLGFKIYF